MRRPRGNQIFSHKGSMTKHEQNCESLSNANIYQLFGLFNPFVLLFLTNFEVSVLVVSKQQNGSPNQKVLNPFQQNGSPNQQMVTTLQQESRK